MAVETISGARVMTSIGANPPGIVPAGLMGGRVRSFLETLEVDAAASVNSTYLLARVPANAYPLPQSRLYWDDLSTSGSPVLKLGLFGAQISDDDNAFWTDLDVAQAGSGTALIGDIADIGRPFWAFVAGQASDPGGELDIMATLAGADVTGGGTLSLSLLYALD